MRRTKLEAEAISKMDVIPDNTSRITKCPNCKAKQGWKVIGGDNAYEDALSCFYCGWRPNAKVQE
tara:strand:+ start:276 stop:470 length:195 start_codon:yes stop_codon:yes gene_type:complete